MHCLDGELESGMDKHKDGDGIMKGSCEQINNRCVYNVSVVCELRIDVY